MSGLEFGFARPWLLAALLLPLLVWWLARRPRRPPEAATGTLAIWLEVVEETSPQGAWRQRRAPWALLVALTLGALALAGPRGARAAPPIWGLLVDRSPSMYLPHEAGGTRLERALALAAAELERLGAAERRWFAFDGLDFVSAAGDAPPAAWLRPPAAPHPEPDWARLDRPWTLWVSDAAPVPAPQAAGLALAGGQAVPGPAAVGAQGELFSFDGRELGPSGERAAPRVVTIAPSVAGPVRALAELWAAERGLELGAPAGGGLAALALEGPLARVPVGELWGGELSGGQTVRIGRDGWELEVTSGSGPGVRAAPDPAAPPEPHGYELALVPWLETDGIVRVAAAPGRVRLAFERAAAPAGDPAAFAVSWSALFDACLLPPAGVVPVAERLAAGPELARGPALESGEPRAGRSRGWPLEAILAGAATLLLLWILGSPRGRGAPGVSPPPPASRGARGGG